MGRTKGIEEMILLQRDIALRQGLIALATGILRHTQHQDASGEGAQLVDHIVTPGGAHRVALGVSPHGAAAELFDRRHVYAGVQEKSIEFGKAERHGLHLSKHGAPICQKLAGEWYSLSGHQRFPLVVGAPRLVFATWQ